MIRRAAAVFAIVVLGGSLAACANSPDDGVQWLRGQAGVIAAETTDSDSSISGTTGSVRGELDPDISDATLAALIDSAAAYLVRHQDVGMRLGQDDFDFYVSTDAADNDAALSLWSRASRSATIITGVVSATEVHIRTLRPSMSDTLATIDGLGVALQVEGFADEAAAIADTTEDDETGDSTGNRVSLAVHWPADCDPDQAQRLIAESFFDQAEVEGGDLVYCHQFDAYYARAASLSVVLPALHADLVTAGMESFPVTAHQTIGGTPDGRTAVVTPGDAAAFDIFEPFESPGTSEAFVTLNDDRSIEVVDYDVPVTDLVGLVQPVPSLGSSPFIRVEGTDAAVGGTASELGSLVTQVVALTATSAQFTNVELNSDAGILALNSPVATDPDIPAAVAALRDSGAWQGRSFIVTYLQTQVNIVDGVASLPTTYTDGHVVQGFADEWNSTAG